MIVKGLMLAFLLASWGTAISVGVWIQDTTEAIIIEKAVPEPEPILPGGRVKIRVEYYVRKACGVHSDRWIQDSNNVRWPLPDLDYKRPPAPTGPNTVVLVLDLDREIAIGPATYVSLPLRWCNPVQYLFPIRDEPLRVPFIVAHRS